MKNLGNNEEQEARKPFSQVIISDTAISDFKNFQAEIDKLDYKQRNDKINEFAKKIADGPILSTQPDPRFDNVTLHGSPPALAEIKGDQSIKFEFVVNENGQLNSDKPRTLTIPHKNRYGNPDPCLGNDVIDFQMKDGRMIASFVQSGDPINSQLDKEWLDGLIKDGAGTRTVSGAKVSGDDLPLQQPQPKPPVQNPQQQTQSPPQQLPQQPQPLGSGLAAPAATLGTTPNDALVNGVTSAGNNATSAKNVNLAGQTPQPDKGQLQKSEQTIRSITEEMKMTTQVTEVTEKSGGNVSPGVTANAKTPEVQRNII